MKETTTGTDRDKQAAECNPYFSTSFLSDSHLERVEIGMAVRRDGTVEYFVDEISVSREVWSDVMRIGTQAELREDQQAAADPDNFPGSFQERSIALLGQIAEALCRIGAR